MKPINKDCRKNTEQFLTRLMVQQKNGGQS